TPRHPVSSSVAVDWYCSCPRGTPFRSNLTAPAVVVSAQAGRQSFDLILKGLRLFRIAFPSMTRERQPVCSVRTGPHVHREAPQPKPSGSFISSRLRTKVQVVTRRTANLTPSARAATRPRDDPILLFELLGTFGGPAPSQFSN